MRVLVLSRNYPNNVTELLGLWVRVPVVHSARFCEPKVIAPVPYCPALPGFPEHYKRFNKIVHRRMDEGVEVFHPRFLSGPGYSTYRHEPFFYQLAVDRLVASIHKTFPFDLLHAHFSYPDGIVATRLGKHYGVPVVISEHIPWDIWNGRYSDIRNRAAQAVRNCSRHISVSKAVRESVRKAVGHDQKLIVIPNSVDPSIFRYSPGNVQRPKDRLLFAGVPRPVKGADILLRSVRLLKDSGRTVHLDFAGEAYYAAYRKEESRLQQMALELGISDQVRFLGKKMPEELAQVMEMSSVLVLPSRMESFGLVLAEALACGTPVISTFSGGPEDIVNDQVGLLVKPDDPQALAKAIEEVLDNSAAFPRAALRSYVLERFGLQQIGQQLEQVYRETLLLRTVHSQASLRTTACQAEKIVL